MTLSADREELGCRFANARKQRRVDASGADVGPALPLSDKPRRADNCECDRKGEAYSREALGGGDFR